LLAIALLASLLAPRAGGQSPVPLEAGLPSVRTWGPKDYRAQAQNWAITQDARGVVYVANGGGVLEFDGQRFRLIPTATRAIARSLAVEPASGRIYVGAVGDVGVLEPGPRGRLEYHSLLRFVPPGARDFSDVFQTFVHGDAVLFASFERLILLRGERAEVFTPKQAFHFAFQVGGRVFVREEGRGLLELKDDRLQLVPGGERFADERVYAMVPWGAKGEILLASRTRGLFVLDPREGFRPLPTDVDAALVRDLVFSGTALPGGGVALGTIQGGVYVLDAGGRLRGRVDKPRGLPDACVWATFVDREGGLWLGLDRGLARVQVDDPLTRFDERAGLPGMVIAVHRHQGRLFAATSQGLFRLEPGPEAHFRPVPGLQNQTWAFASVDGPADSSLLVANNDGVFELRGDRVRLAMAGDGASALHVSRATPGRVFVGLTDGLASMRRAGDTWLAEGLIPGAGGDVRRIFEDAAGRVWAGTQAQGVLRVSFGPAAGPARPQARVERFGIDDGLPGPVENSVYPVGGEPVFGTHRGVMRFDEKARRFALDPRLATAFPGRPPRVSSLREDSRGGIWLHLQDETGSSNETGVALPQPDGSYRWDPRPLRAMGESSGIWALHAEPGGSLHAPTLWAGGDDGLFRLDTSRPRSFEQRFATLVRQVGRVGAEPVHGGAGGEGAVELTHAREALRVEFAASTFVAPEATRFQVLLEGNDAEWSAWGAEGFREYTNLGPGRYRLRVRSRDLFGTEGEEASFAFRIAPPWYRTPLAWGAWLLLAAGAGRGLVRWRLRRVEAEKRTLEGMIALRTRELRARNDQLETLEKIVRSINERQDFDELLETMLRECRGVVRGVEKAAALVRQPGSDTFTFRAALGYQTQDEARIELGLAEAEARYVAGAHEVSPDVFLIRDAAGRPGEAKLRLKVAPAALLVVRIRIDGQVEGYLVFSNERQVDAFDAHDLDLLRALREHFLSAFDKARSLRLLERARQAAEDARLRAEEASRAKSAFLAHMSHELRTPLHGVLGFAQLMDRAPDRSLEDRAHLATILRSGEHLLGLINDVLSLSRIEAGQLALREAPFDPGALLTAVAALVRVRAEARGLALVTEKGALPAAVIGDEGKLRQVLLNLLGNAVKFTAAGRVTLRASWAADRAVFEVEDTGPGIAAEELEGLFAAFVQSEAGRRAEEGSGLGLALSRQFARLMGGDLTAQSEVGRGSRFRLDVRLPAAAPGQAVAGRGDRRRVRALAADQPAWRLLVVDDVTENRVLLRDLLRSVGFDVREAADGEQAVALWREWRPHLVWMDKRMPGTDGLEATRLIRAEERATGRPRVPILALSASALDHERSAILAAGCDDFVPKPFREGALFEKMAEHLGVHYLYDLPAAAAGDAAPVTAARIAARPEEWRRALREALATGDIDAARVLADEAEADDAALARDLRALLAAFRLDELERALREGGPA
jgi:signal transduction histidine kinase/CheY-like chemotaxis protein/ligand-binding sensor domain-containing protein